jgi:hypothetical protein
MSELQDKAMRARMRECFDETRTHIRAGSWRGLEEADISLVGLVSVLHGSVCTCCKGSLNYRGEDR